MAPPVVIFHRSSFLNCVLKKVQLLGQRRLECAIGPRSLEDGLRPDSSYLGGLGFGNHSHSTFFRNDVAAAF